MVCNLRFTFMTWKYGNIAPKSIITNDFYTVFVHVLCRMIYSWILHVLMTTEIHHTLHKLNTAIQETEWEQKVSRHLIINFMNGLVRGPTVLPLFLPIQIHVIFMLLYYKHLDCQLWGWKNVSLAEILCRQNCRIYIYISEVKGIKWWQKGLKPNVCSEGIEMCRIA